MFNQEMVVVWCTGLSHQEAVNKMKLVYKFCVVLPLLLSACSQDNSTHLVSMVALLANPEKFDGKRILVTGYLGRGNDIYLTKEYSEINDRNSALLLNLDESNINNLSASQCRDKYVEVTGVFGLVNIKGLAPRLGINKVSAIKNQATNVDCIKIIVWIDSAGKVTNQNGVYHSDGHIHLTCNSQPCILN